jgi:hypothetical protein
VFPHRAGLLHVDGMLARAGGAEDADGVEHSCGNQVIRRGWQQ